MSRIWTTAVATTVWVLLCASPATAEGFGPFVEIGGGLGLQTLQETGGSATMDSGASLSVVAGVPATRWLAVEFMSVVYASGSVSDSKSTGGALAKDWRMDAYLLGVRYDILEPLRGLDVGMAGGLGITRLDIGVIDADIRDQHASAFTYYLAGRSAYRVVAGLSVGAELRFLITPTWRDEDGENVEVEAFGAVPVLLQATLGYELEIF